MQTTENKVMLINVTKEPLKVRHICYFVRPNYFDSRILDLYEVVVRTYPHPEAPEDAVIDMTDIDHLGEYPPSDGLTPNLILLEACERATVNARPPEGKVSKHS
jgi:hypothetical protein